MFKEAESRPDKIESTSNNVQARKKQQHRRRACDLLASLKRFYWPNTRIPMCLNRPQFCKCLFNYQILHIAFSFCIPITSHSNKKMPEHRKVYQIILLNCYSVDNSVWTVETWSIFKPILFFMASKSLL